MKNNNFIRVGLCLFLSLQVFAQDLIITGIYDGPLSGGTPKGVELYVQNDIPDLSVYGLGVANNGDGSDGIEFTFPAQSASQGAFIYVTTNLEQFEAYFGFQANFQTGSITVNGDDAVELFYHENLMDVFGDPNRDGSGTEWEYTDGWAYRENDRQPKTSFSAADWSFSGVNALDNTSVNSDANLPFPVGSYSREATSEPVLSIRTPTAGSIIYASSVDIDMDIQNFTLSLDNGSGVSDGSGDGFIRLQWIEEQELQFTQNLFETSLADIPVVAGKTYTINVGLVDNQGNEFVPQVTDAVTFSVEFPCDLIVEEPIVTCQNESGVSDFYSVALPFSGGDSGVLYSISALDAENNPIGNLEGEHPNNQSTGQLRIVDIPIDSSIHLGIDGDEQSSCTFSISIDPPNCNSEVTCPSEGAVIITEIMQNPAAVSDSNGEYFEVYNTTTEPIDLMGWTISTAGSGDPVTHTISTSLLIPAQSHLVFAENADPGTNGGIQVDYQYDSSLFLGNGSASIEIACNGVTIDVVSYDDGASFPDPNGASMQLATDKYSHIENDFGEHWSEATEPLGSGGDFGTPGFSSSNVLSTSDNNQIDFRIYPNPTTNKQITISTQSTMSKKLLIFDVLGKKVFSRTLEKEQSLVDLQGLKSGIYILKLFEGTKMTSKKLIIQ